MKKNTIFTYLCRNVKNEILSWGILLKHEWKIVLFTIITVSVLVIISRPLPPKEVYMAVGPKGSTYRTIAEKYKEKFEDYGVTLHLVESNDTGKSLAKITNDEELINAGLITSGISEKGDYPELLSLGSIEFTPLWVFYKGDKYKKNADIFELLRDKKTIVSNENTSSNLLLSKMLSLRNETKNTYPKLKEVESEKILEEYNKEENEAVIILDGINSPTIQKLISDKNNNIFNFHYAPAYVKKLPFMETVTIPEGSLDIKNLSYPSEDIKLLSSTATLLIDKNLHPAIQQMFLETASAKGKEENQFFSKVNYFPSHNDKTIELSDAAIEYYKNNGVPLSSKIPLWLASYIDRVWLLIIGLIAIAVPIFNIIPNYRQTRLKILLQHAYDELREIEKTSINTKEINELNKLKSKLENLQEEVTIEWDGVENGEQIYNLKNSIQNIKKQISNRINMKTVVVKRVPKL